MTFDYVTVPEGINVDADIYPLRVGRADERVLYGIDPAFIVEACMERRNALGIGDVRKYVLGRGVRRILERAEGATSRNGIDFLKCVEPIRAISRHQNFIGGWLNRDFAFSDISVVFSPDEHPYVNLEDVYPGSTITDWASTVEHSNRIIGLDELKACYHDIARMSRALVNGTVKHSAYTEVVSFAEQSDKYEIEREEGYGFATAYYWWNTIAGNRDAASGLYFKACSGPLSPDYQTWSAVGFADPVYSFEGVDKYKAVTALFLLETWERNGDTSKFYYDIIARPVGKDGSVSFDNSTARSVCLGNSSLQPVKDQDYVIQINCLEACLAANLNLKTDISDIGVKTIAEPN